MRKTLTVCWLSAGVSSFIAGYLLRNEIDEFIYIDVEDQHEDSMRFITDCENALGKPITILKSEYGTVENACIAGGFINRPKVGAYCTKYLKKRVRTLWEMEHTMYDIIYVWGYDAKESRRAEQLVEAYPDVKHVFPLIDRTLSKEDCHSMLRDLNMKRPKMYDLGYPNNNCIGCVKGGMGYWNKIRIDFPDVFEKRAKLERKLGCSCINGIFLDELAPDRGKMDMEIIPECSIFCSLEQFE